MMVTSLLVSIFHWPADFGQPSSFQPLRPTSPFQLNQRQPFLSCLPTVVWLFQFGPQLGVIFLLVQV
jgi:hypothetical protein